MEAKHLLLLLLLSAHSMLPSAMFADTESNSFVRENNNNNSASQLESHDVALTDDKTTKPVVLEIYYDTNDLICQMYILSRVSRTWQEVGEDPGKSKIGAFILSGSHGPPGGILLFPERSEHERCVYTEESAGGLTHDKSPAILTSILTKSGNLFIVCIYLLTFQLLWYLRAELVVVAAAAAVAVAVVAAVTFCSMGTGEGDEAIPIKK